MTRCCALLSLVLLTVFVAIPAAASRTVEAVRINQHAPRIDGHLNDPVWQKAKFVTGFQQKIPNEGEPAANRSEVAIMYDDDAVYIAARLHSTNPDNILSTVSRRDNGGTSERIIISLDTYNDKTTAYSFAVTASGTRIDYFHGSDHEGTRDYDWNPVWSARSARTATGWTAEMRIPFTQLRFENRDVQVWGINMNRWVPTDNEDSYFIVVPQAEVGWSSRMGELTGIEGIKPSRRLEVTPYYANDYTKESDVDPDDPFNDGEDFNARVGGEFKMGVGPNLTLEGTVNPDFGQVEADPAEVNLSAFETFFSERRPFFIEGSNLLQGQGAGYFYSRRIGAPPRLFPDADYVDQPDNSSILGAAKLTGRMNSGLSVGFLAAVTENEKAKTFNLGGEETEVNVAPTTGYSVLRLQQEFGEHKSSFGVIGTAVNRDLSVGDGIQDALAQKAFTGGADWKLRFQGGKYQILGNVGFSSVRGKNTAITGIQHRSTHYYQRPDADYVDVDSLATSLNGWVAQSHIEKNGGEHWIWAFGGAIESPGFELNDLGQLSQADERNVWSHIRWRETEPTSLFQQYYISLWSGSGWNFGGDREYAYFDLGSEWIWKNFYGTWFMLNYQPPGLSKSQTRGGPLMGTNGWIGAELSAWSNARSRLQYDAWVDVESDGIGGRFVGGGVGATYRSGGQWEASIGPRYHYNVNSRQYVTTIEGGGPQETFDNRYVFAFIERSTLVAQTRLNYSFTPDLTLELYAEPFAASGRYYNYGELPAPRSRDIRKYGRDGTTVSLEDDGSRTVTDGAETFTLDNDDFNFVSFRSNAVLRWEWAPGSTLFLVWQSNRSGSNSDGSLVGLNDFGDALGAEGDNFFALKLTYWLPVR